MAYASRYVKSSVLNIILNFLKVPPNLVIVMTVNLTVSASTRAMAGTSRNVDSSFLNVVLNCFFFSLSLVVERKTAFTKFDFPSSLLNIILSYFSNVSFLTPVVTKINFTVCSAMRAMAYASRYVESSVLNIILNFLKVPPSKLVIVMTINLTVSASTRAVAGTSRNVDSSFLNVVLNCFFFSLSLVVERKTAFTKFDFPSSLLNIILSYFSNVSFLTPV